MILKSIVGSIFVILSRVVVADTSPQEEFRRGVVFFNEAEYADAFVVFDKLNANKQVSGTFNYYYGLSLLKTDKSEQAIAAMKRAIAIEPGNAEYRYALGLVYASRMSELSLMRAAMMIGAAKDTLLKAVELDSNHVGAVRALAEMLLDVPGAMGGDTKTAQDLIKKLWTLDSASAAALEAKSQTRSGNQERVENLLTQAVKAPGSEAVFRLRLAKFYVDRQEYSKAIAYGQEYLGMPKHWYDSSRDTTYAHLWMAVAYHAVGDNANFQEHFMAVDTNNMPARIRKEIAERFETAGITH